MKRLHKRKSFIKEQVKKKRIRNWKGSLNLGPKCQNMKRKNDGEKGRKMLKGPAGLAYGPETPQC